MAKKGFVPELDSKMSYPLWKRKVEAWQIITTEEKKKQAIQLALRIRCDAISQALFSKLSVEDMNKDGGVKTLIAQLDKICMANTVEGVFTTIEKVEQFRRTPDMTISQYLEEFDRLKGLVDENMPEKEDGTGKRDCSDSILAFRMMKQANLVESEELMVRAHVRDLTSVEMAEVLKRIFGERVVATGQRTSNSSNHVSFSPDVAMKQETYMAWDDHHLYQDENVYAGNHYSKFRNWKKKSYPIHPSRGGDYNQSNQSSKHQKNAVDRNGNVSTCHICGSEWHWARDCDQKPGHGDQRPTTKETFFVSDVYSTYTGKVEGNKAVLDTGAPTTVCGKAWYKMFKDSLTAEERREITESATDELFRFGDGEVVKATKLKIIPVSLCGKEFLLRTHVVERDIPLLFSRSTISRLKCFLDFKHDKIWIDGKCQDMMTNDSGHMLVIIGRRNDKRPRVDKRAENRAVKQSAEIRAVKNRLEQRKVYRRTIVYSSSEDEESEEELEDPAQLEIADEPVVAADQVDRAVGASPVLENSEGNHGNHSQIEEKFKTQNQEKSIIEEADTSDSVECKMELRTTARLAQTRMAQPGLAQTHTVKRSVKQVELDKSKKFGVVSEVKDKTVDSKVKKKKKKKDP